MHTLLFNRFLLGNCTLVSLWIFMMGSLQRQELLSGVVLTIAASYLSLSRLRILNVLLTRLSLAWNLLNISGSQQLPLPAIMTATAVPTERKAR